MLTSDFSRATGAYMSTASSYYGNGWWWLRSPNNLNSLSARYVDRNGYADNSIRVCNYISGDGGDNVGVVPALNLTLS